MQSMVNPLLKPLMDATGYSQATVYKYLSLGTVPRNKSTRERWEATVKKLTKARG